MSQKWANIAANEATGYGTSIIGCDVEAGVERPGATLIGPDGRPGCQLLFLARSEEKLVKSVQNRCGQCLLTCPTTDVYDALTGPDQTFPLGEWVRYFGDQYEEKTRLHDRSMWRIPVMDGHCHIEIVAGMKQMVAGGLFLILAKDQGSGLTAAERALDAIHQLEGVITPFPGGLVRAGSRVGSRYPGVPAATNAPYCPALVERVDSKLPEGVNCVYEIVINGLTTDHVRKAIGRGAMAACGEGVIQITSSHYDGKLGSIKIGLRDAVGDAI